MVDGKCFKQQYARAIIANTVSDDDGCPWYRRRTTEDYGNLSNINMNNGDIDADNCWVIPYFAIKKQ